MKLALAQIDTTVGDVPGNLARMRNAVSRLDADVDLVVFPELCILGYPPRDLVERRGVVREVEAGLEEFTSGLRPGLAAVVGTVDWPEDSMLPRNVAALVQDGNVHRVIKRLLPTYDVFDEKRYFAPGSQDQAAVFPVRGVAVGIVICEDLWNDAELWSERRYLDDPAHEVAQAGARLILNVSASPFDAGKRDVRARLLAHAARRHGVGLAMCNLVGGNDSLVFDGSSMAANPGGELVAVAESFREDVLLLGWEEGFEVLEVAAAARAREVVVRGPVTLTPRPCHVDVSDASLDDMENALCAGLEGYMGKLGFDRAVLGLSGGIDSALTAHLAARVLGGAQVLAVEMPSRFTTDLSREISARLISELGLQHEVLPIDPVQDAFLEALDGPFAGTEPGVAEENIQARIRGALLMAISNKRGPLLLSTGNKSEMAVGYCTLYGDMNGGLAVISDVFKLQVYALCRRINARAGREVIPAAVIGRPPSAELRADQTDQDTLPPYEVLDPILAGVLEDRLEDLEIARETGSDLGLVRSVRKMVDRAEFKRYQAAPTIRVSRKAWHGRRYPIVAARGWGR